MLIEENIKSKSQIVEACLNFELSVFLLVYTKTAH